RKKRPVKRNCLAITLWSVENTHRRRNERGISWIACRSVTPGDPWASCPAADIVIYLASGRQAQPQWASLSFGSKARAALAEARVAQAAYSSCGMTVTTPAIL